MIRSSLPLLCLAGVFSHTALADDYSVAEKPFKKVTTLSGTFLPTNSTAISIAPEVWADFTITSFVSQGSVVQKGDVLIGIDTKTLDMNITKAEKEREIDLLNLAKAKHELAQLEITTPLNLEKYARAEKEAANNLKWFTEIGMPRDIESTERSIKSAELGLAYQLEELKQLEKMYSEDNKTEETEEIILIRTRNSVERAKFLLKSTKISATRRLDTQIPRELEESKRTAKSASIANAAAQKSLTRSLEIKRLEIAKAEKADAQKAEKLTKLKADRALMNITAPADGLVYYGSIKNGKWNPVSALKILKVGGKIPSNLPLMTFIPNNSTLSLSAFAAEAQLATLKKGTKGRATTALTPYSSFPVSVTKVGTHPEADSKYHVEISQDAASAKNIVAGMKATIRIITDRKDKAILVPVDYLSPAEDGGFTVKLKLADGQTADRPVEISASNKKHAVITKGIEVGQVIVK